MAATLKCFHCGFPVAADKARYVTINDERRPVCCAGCEAVASLTAGQSLETDVKMKWRIYDRAALQRNLVRTTRDGDCEAAFVIEGIHCAACGLTIEKKLKAVPGVIAIEVNPTTRRARLTWQRDRVALSSLLAAIDDLGYTPHPVSHGQIEDFATTERRQAMKRIVVAGFGMMLAMTYAIAGYAGAWDGSDPGLARFLNLVSLLVATPVVFYSARPFFAGAWRDLKALRPGMDVPVALAIGGAYVASVAVMLVPGIEGDVYFDSVVMFTFFLSLGRYLEMNARHRTGQATDALAEMLPASVTRLVRTEAGIVETVVPLVEIQPGDTLLIRPGEPVPADGTIVAGESSADESMLTGESNPQQKSIGDRLTGGSVNLTGALEIEVDKTGGDTVLSNIVRLLERAQGERPPVARIADKVASWFVAGVLLAAAAVWIYWMRTEPDAAFRITLSVLVVTCPCALSLATPTAITAATGRLAQLGLLVTRARAVETLAKATSVVFDKTGTLTQGRMTITDTSLFGSVDRDEAVHLAAALEYGSTHPIAVAFRDIETPYRAERIKQEAGKGLEGQIDGKTYRVGTPAFVAELSGVDSGEIVADSAGTSVVIGNDDGLIAAFALADAPRAGTRETLERLAALGLPSSIASGDQEDVVARLAGRLGVTQFRARQTPEDKLRHMRDAQAKGGIVAMVGDGINDAPVLGGANVSIAMGAGTALAQASADLVLLGERIEPLVGGVKLARRAVGVIRQNLVWALVYNALALPLAAAGYVAPWMAAIGMSLSSLIVVLNSLRLARGRKDEPQAGLPITTRGQPA